MPALLSSGEAVPGLAAGGFSPLETQPPRGSVGKAGGATLLRLYNPTEQEQICPQDSSPPANHQDESYQASLEQELHVSPQLHHQHLHTGLEGTAGGSAELEPPAEQRQRKAGRKSRGALPKADTSLLLHLSALLPRAWRWLGERGGCRAKATNPRFN